MKTLSKLSLSLFFIGYFLAITTAQNKRPIGINLTGIVDYSTEFEFTDVFKQSRNWISHDLAPGSDWSSDVNIPLGINGYPLEIPYDNGVDPTQGIRTLMYFTEELAGHYPSGQYRLIASGTGRVTLWGAAQGTYSCPVDTMVSVNSLNGGIGFEIEESIASDPVKDIRFIMPDYVDTYETTLFNPELISFVEDFEVIRFMDWMKTNGSENTIWEDRNTPDYYSQTLNNGVAYEYIIQLCNQTKINAWICIPHKADDNYILEMAKLFKNQLDPNLKLYIEYSNEVWNGAFPQNYYADSLGTTLGYTGEPWERSWQYYSKRSADVMQIFETEFGVSDRLVKLLASQSVGYVSNRIIEHFNDSKYNPTLVKADAIAIAPYFGGELGNHIGDNGLSNSISVDEILDLLENTLEESFDRMDAHRIVANTHNLDLITYEGGQHLVAGWQYINDDILTQKLTDANRHERMQDLYCQYFDHWYNDTNGDLFCQFSSHGLFGRYGSWGLKEFYSDTLSPKYLSMQNCVFNYNIDTTTAVIPTDKTSLANIFPNPSNGDLLTIKHEVKFPEFTVLDITGKIIPFSIVEKMENSTILGITDYEGLVIIRLESNDKIISKRVMMIRGK